jgi:hypothetical protein
LTFESESRLTRIEPEAFLFCWHLKSICIPASVEIIGQKCFADCRCLSSFTFESESESRLTLIEASAFSRCVNLKSIVLPSSIRGLPKHWAIESSLRHVKFQSGTSTHRCEVY